MPLRGGVSRARRKVAREGLWATAAHAGYLLRRPLYLRERHVWYRLDLPDGIADRALPEGVTIARAAAPEVASVEELGQNLEDAEAHFAEGHELWLTHEGGAVLFACWLFRGHAPVVAAPSGVLDLAPATVCLENSFTAEHARGRGIAPASWCEVARRVHSEGSEAMITKVEVDNAPSRRAVTKSGFREIGVMEFTRIARWSRTTLRSSGDQPGDLAERLGATAKVSAPT